MRIWRYHRLHPKDSFRGPTSVVASPYGRPRRSRLTRSVMPSGTHQRSWPVAIDREEDGPRSSVLGHRAFVVRRRRAGRPQRSEDRTGPATSGGGRRPHLNQRKETSHSALQIAVSDSD
jgi:hypothetical protein